MPPRRKKPAAEKHTTLPGGALETVFDSNPSALPPTGQPPQTPKMGRPRKKSVRIVEPDQVLSSPTNSPEGDILKPGGEAVLLLLPSSNCGYSDPLDLAENPFIDHLTTPATVAAVTSPFFTAILDLANNLEPLALDNLNHCDNGSPEPLPTGWESPVPHAPTTPGSVISSNELVVSDSDSESVPVRKQREAKDLWPFIRKDGEGWRICRLCEEKRKKFKNTRISKWGVGTSTTTIRRHFYTSHFKEWYPACVRMGVTIVSKNKSLQRLISDYQQSYQSGLTNDAQVTGHTGTVPIIRQYSPEALSEGLVEWIISDDQSLSVVDNPKLRSIFLMLRSDLRNSDIPSRHSLRSKIVQSWEKNIEDLKKQVKKAVGKLSFTTDLWSDPNLTSYMAVTMHWIETIPQNAACGIQYVLRLRADLIGFFHVPLHHTGSHLGAIFLHVLDRLDAAEKIGWITLDNASNNDTMVVYLEEHLTVRGIDFSAQNQRIRCFPHIVNLAVQAILTKVTDMKYALDTSYDYNPPPTTGRTNNTDVVALLRNAVRAIRSSSHRREAFKKSQKRVNVKQLQLIRDVSTRWSSTHLMIERALQQRTAIDSCLSRYNDLHRYKLSFESWDILTRYSEILQVPHAFQQKLSSEYTPTLSRALPYFLKMIQRWEGFKLSMPNYAHIIDRGIEKLKDYQDRALLVDANTLSILINPARKLQWFTQNQPNDVMEAQQLFRQCLRNYRTNAGVQTPKPKQTLSKSSLLDTANSNFGWADEILDDIVLAPVAGSKSLDEEIEAYLVDGQVAMDPLTFWQENQLRYPTIFLLAIDYLPIQGSAVPCERVFSSAKETITPRRNRISPDLMEALQMLKFSVKHGGTLNFTAGTSLNDELVLLEEHEESISQCPDDLGSFLDTLIAVDNNYDD